MGPTVPLQNLGQWPRTHPTESSWSEAGSSGSKRSCLGALKNLAGNLLGDGTEALNELFQSIILLEIASEIFLSARCL
jgi:hypothetical protein